MRHSSRVVDSKAVQRVRSAVSELTLGNRLPIWKIMLGCNDKG